MNFGGRGPGETVVGQIKVYNAGEPFSWLIWFVDTVNVPNWGT